MRGRGRPGGEVPRRCRWVAARRPCAASGVVLGVLAGLAFAAPRSVLGQEPSSAPPVALSRDTVALGDAFELRIAFDVPPGHTAYVPDTIPSTEHVESLRPVEWSVDAAPGGVTRLAVVYSLIALRDGTAALPDLTIFTAPADEDEPPVGSWPSIDARDGSTDSTLTAHVVTLPEVHVESVLALLASEEGLVPRPPDDVVGPSWSMSALLATLLFGGALAVVLGATGRDWLRARAAKPVVSRADPLEEAKRAALAALDELPELGLIEGGRVDEFYARTSAAVRAYVEHFDPAWSSALTSTELIGALEGRSNGTAAPDLRREMGVAEIVKFGRVRPDAREAEGHRQVLRAWIAEGAGRT